MMSADLYAAFGTEPKAPTDPTHSIAPPTPSPVPPLTLVPQHPQIFDENNVLFDANGDDDEDDFGDFEAVEEVIPAGSATKANALPVTGSKKSQPTVAVPDLLDMDLETGEQPLTQVNYLKDSGIGGAYRKTATAEDDMWGDFEDTHTLESLELARSQINEAAQQTTDSNGASADFKDDDWEPFDDKPALPAAQASALLSPQKSLQKITPQPVPTKASTTTATQRPINIPPPSSLLQLLSAVFRLLHKDNVNGNGSKPELAGRIMLVFRSASRIVAGRALRWKRDTGLAQSVRIGQAGKSGGMKLTAVNKGEMTKEDRDAEDLVQDWSKHLHEFNSILAQAGLAQHRLKLSSAIPLKISKQSNGTDNSKQCALCGLKRTERIGDVDASVDDLFGEFWIEFWGHRDCCDFWSSYNNSLSQR